MELCTIWPWNSITAPLWGVLMVVPAPCVSWWVLPRILCCLYFFFFFFHFYAVSVKKQPSCWTIVSLKTNRGFYLCFLVQGLQYGTLKFLCPPLCRGNRLAWRLIVSPRSQLTLCNDSVLLPLHMRSSKIYFCCRDDAHRGFAPLLWRKKKKGKKKQGNLIEPTEISLSSLPVLFWYFGDSPWMWLNLTVVGQQAQ